MKREMSGLAGLLRFGPVRRGESAGEARALADLQRALIAAAERLDMSDAEANRLERALQPPMRAAVGGHARAGAA